jgi:hypothetical protein
LEEEEGRLKRMDAELAERSRETRGSEWRGHSHFFGTDLDTAKRRAKTEGEACEVRQIRRGRAHPLNGGGGMRRRNGGRKKMRKRGGNEEETGGERNEEEER